MKRLVIVALVALVSHVSPAFADVTMKSTVASKGMGQSTTMVSTTYLKGGKMRNDVVMGDTTRTTIFDLDTQKMTTFDSKKKEADVYDMQKMSADMSKSVQVSELKASIKPNGKTKELLGKTATGYDMTVSIPASAGGMKMVVNLEGPMWIVKNAPGAAEYLAFYKAAVDKGWFFSDPGTAKAQPGQAKAMAEVQRQLASTGGIPYEQEMTVKMSGEGPMKAMFEKMGNMTSTTTVTGIEAGTLAADLFNVPAGYKLKEQK